MQVGFKGRDRGNLNPVEENEKPRENTGQSGRFVVLSGYRTSKKPRSSGAGFYADLC
jgi:hypothetical protein